MTVYVCGVCGVYMFIRVWCMYMCGVCIRVSVYVCGVGGV